jgi:hypothetical protein
VSIEVGYNRRWWLNNETVVDNSTNVASDFGQFSVTTPTDSRLPAEAQGRVISGIYNVNPNVAALQNNVTTLASKYGGQSTVTNGVLFNVSARPRNGLVFQGGLATGATRNDYCAVLAQLPEIQTASGTLNVGVPGVQQPFCNYSSGLITRFTGLGSYTLPKVDVLLSGTFRSDQGGSLAANYAVTSAAANAGGLGRPLSNAAPNVTVNLIEPGTLFGDRVNEFDVRLAKILRFGRTRTNVGFDIYNILNSAPVLTYNQGFIPNGNWLIPTSVLQPRFWKFSVQVDF